MGRSSLSSSMLVQQDREQAPPEQHETYSISDVSISRSEASPYLTSRALIIVLARFDNLGVLRRCATVVRAGLPERSHMQTAHSTILTAPTTTGHGMPQSPGIMPMPTILCGLYNQSSVTEL